MRITRDRKHQKKRINYDTCHSGGHPDRNRNQIAYLLLDTVYFAKALYTSHANPKLRRTLLKAMEISSRRKSLLIIVSALIVFLCASLFSTENRRVV
jgi:hypothetical protein